MGDVILAVYPSGSISKTGLVIPLTPLTQQSGTWEVETSGLGKCGYVVQAYAVDRAIVNNAPFGNSSQLQSFGFCLR
jgi:hypothetical protein